MSQHGRRVAKADKPQKASKPASTRAAASSRRRFGPLSAESLLVLTLAGIIAGASVLVNQVAPGRHRTQTTVGATTYNIHNVGEGGIKPGEIQPRTVTPVQVAKSDKVSDDAGPPTPKPVATKKGAKPTPVPTAPAAGTIGTGSPTGGGTTGGGSGGGTGTGGAPCTGLGSLLGGCGTKPTATGPQAGATPPAQ